MTPYHGSSQARNYKLYDFVAHGSAVTCLALGQKSGRVMVTGGDDAKVNLWAVGKPNCIMSLHGHKTSVECAKFNYSEDVVGAGSASGAIKLWDLEAVKLIQTLTGHRTNVRCLDFHPYGQFLASGSFDTSIKLWDYRKKGCIYTYKIHSNEVHCLRLSPDGRWLASGGADGSVLLYDIVASKVLAELKQGGHSAAVTDLVFHPNEFLLASGSLDGTVKFWDLESFAQVSSSSSSSASGGYLGPVRKVAFHPEGRALLAAGRDALKVFGWEPTVLYDSVDVHWGGNGGRLADMAVLEGQLVAGSCSRAATDASVYLVDIASLRPFCGGEEKGRKGDGLDDEGLLGDQATTFPRNTLRQSTRRSFNFDQSSKTCKHLESLESNKSNSSGGDDHLETATVSSDGDGEAGSAAEIFSTCDYKEIFHSRRELCRTPPVDDSPAPTADAIVGSLPPSYSVASFATTNSSSSSSSPSSSSSNSSVSGKSLTGIAPITSRGRHPTLNASMKTGISESLTNLAASYKNNNLGLHLNLNLNNNTSVHLNQQQQLSHASSLSGLNHLKVGGGDYHHHPNPNQTAHQHFPALLSSTAKPPPPPPPVNQHYPVLTPIPPLSSALNNNSSSHHHNSTRNHNLPNKITSVVRPVVNDASGGGGAHRPPLSQTVRPQPKTDNHQAGRINRDRSTSTSNIVSTIAAGDHHHNHHHHHHHHQQHQQHQQPQQQPSSQFIIPDTRDGHSSGLLDYNDFLPKHIVQYGYDAQPPLTELEALAAIGGKGHRAAKASLDYRRRQVAIVLAMWATKDARTALEYAVNLDEKSVVIDILNVMVLKASTWNHDICLILLPCIQELLESKYESYMSVGCSALSLILKTFSSVIKNSIAAPPGIGVDISREERYNKCMKCYNHLLSARAFVLKRQTLQGKIGRSFRELSILMQNLE